MKRLLLWLIGVALGVAVLLAAVMGVSYSFTSEGAKPASAVQFAGQELEPNGWCWQVPLLGGQLDKVFASPRTLTVQKLGVLFFWPSSFTLPNILRAAGDASFTMTVSIVSMWVFRVGFCYLWVLKMGGGLLSIWMGMYLDWAFRSICFVVRFVRGKWLEQKVI